MSEFDELRALVREVIRDVLPNGLPGNGLPVTETVDLSTNEDLAAFVDRLLNLDPGEREDLQAGRKRFRLAPGSGAGHNGTSVAPDLAALAIRLAPPQPPAPPAPTQFAQGAKGPIPAGTPVRRVESGAVTEALVKQAAQAGERLVLGRSAVLTPLARDRARASGVEIVKER
ncbi:MAG TPA: hypothetical protein VIX15_18335 [Streptosporangiaceae bacterium]